MTVEAHAKVNLSLEVFGKRADGYREIRTVLAPIGLCDVLEFNAAEEGQVSTDTGYGEGDLVVKAVRALWAVGARGGVSVKVEKRIPVGGGLGGGSADAAATLVALNSLWGLGKTVEEIALIGAAVGSDVPALVLANACRSAVLAEGRGEKVRLLPWEVAFKGSSRLEKRLVLANPHVHSSTAEVYSRCAVRTALSPCPVNDLQEPACAIYPEIGAAIEALSSAGAENVMMSGSGATVFGYAKDDTAAEAIAEKVRAKGMWAAVTQFLL